MTTQVEAAAIAAVVSLATAGIGAALTLAQSKRERSKWLVDVKSGYALERYRHRLSTYPQVFEALEMLSHARREADVAKDAARVADALNRWIYSAGGMCADASTRGALVALRHKCAEWAESGERPGDLYSWRNVAIQMLRRDLDLQGRNEVYDFDNVGSALQMLKEEVDRQLKAGRRTADTATPRATTRRLRISRGR